MSKFVFIFICVLGNFASAEDVCLAQLENQFQGYFLQHVTQNYAKRMIQSSKSDFALALEKAKVAAQDSQNLFYKMAWTAPGSRGIDILILDHISCQTLSHVTVAAEE